LKFLQTSRSKQLYGCAQVRSIFLSASLRLSQRELLDAIGVAFSVCDEVLKPRVNPGL